MKRLTQLHKPALFVFFFSFSLVLQAQQTIKPKSDRWFRREAFKDFKHFYLGAQIGLGAPMMYYEKTDYGQNPTTYAHFAFTFNPSIPPNRIFAGYTFKRHSFELGIEGKSYYFLSSSYDPSAIVYVIPRYGTYFSFGYMINILPKKSHFKLHLGANLGPYFSQYFGISPVMGVNGMLEIPVTRTVALLMDVRYNLGFTQVGQSNGYYTTYRYRLMALDFNFGFKVRLFKWADTHQGINTYEEIKTRQ